MFIAFLSSLTNRLYQFGQLDDGLKTIETDLSVEETVETLKTKDGKE